jgi:hypothetical protein
MHAVSAAEAVFQHKSLALLLRLLSYYATAIAGRLGQILHLPSLE